MREEEDVSKHVEEAKKLIRPGIETTELRDEFEEKGVTGKRFVRLLHLAGAIVKGFQPREYVLAYKGESPIKKYAKRKFPKKWLAERLAHGPGFYPAIKEEADTAGISESALRNSHKKLGRHREYYRHAGSPRWAFWRLADHSPLGKEEAHRIIAEYLAKKQEAESKAKPAKAKNDANGDTPKAASAPIATIGDPPMHPNGKHLRKMVTSVDEENREVTISGAIKKVTQAQVDVVNALFKLRGNGLTKDQMAIKSGRTGWRGILKSLVDSDPDWADVIVFPGANAAGGYRLRC